MFQPTSRYAGLATKTLAVMDSDGAPREVRYVERRFLPPAGAGQTLVEHIVVQGDRLDRITAKYIGDPTQFWRVADANEAMRPEELTDDVGGRIVIALPQR
jgi:hypothetical protein